MIIATLAIFQAWICVAVGIGKFLHGLGVRNIFNTKLPGLGAWLVFGWLFHFVTVAGCCCNGVKSAHRETN